MTKLRPVCLYMLTDPRPTEMCYIGITVNPYQRWHGHLSDTRGCPKSRKNLWLMELRKAHLEPIMTILDVCGQAEARQAEKDAVALIRAVRGHNLLNKVKGDSLARQ